MKGRQVKEGFLSLESIEYVCHSEGEWARQKDLTTFERGMVVGARRTGLCEELQRCCVFHVQQYPKGHPANLTQLQEALESTWASIPVECFRHLVESMP